jgi:cysteine desulfurase
MACSLPNIINFSIRGMDNDVLLIAMDTAGVAVSAGSACEAGALEPSHVLAAMGTGEEWIHGSIRVSVGKENTMAEMEQAIVVMQSILDTAQGGKHE